ncbi:MAG TPA: TIGR02679 family protein [Acidimicrobiales bacterium]|nr:TIGR02679 family protein [Acidimicrobiales bacterium]
MAPLVDELARRFGEGTVPVLVTVPRLSMAQRLALADLFGLDRLPAETAKVRVARLAAALGLDSVEALRGAVEEVRGPLPDRRAERLAHRSARDELWSWLEAEALAVPLFRGAPAAVPAWVERVRAQGPRGGVDAHRRRLETALGVLRALPADNVALAAFASDVAGDPHALDRGRRVAAVVLDAVALATGSPLAASAESARDLWESVGVAPDPLSSTVLALGLPGAAAPGPLGPWLAAAAAASEPVVLTLAQLRRWPVPPLPADAVAYVVENPSLVAEAARTGWTGRPPLVCSSGRPTVAVVTLLRQLGAAGAELRQHADFDAAGLSITAWLAERAGTTPWRMTAADYAAPPGAPGPPGALPPTPWDPALQRAMSDAGAPVYEEQLRGALLDAMV